MDNEIYDSLLQSSRRVQEIQIKVGDSEPDAVAERITDIVEKFKCHLKKLDVNLLPYCSQKTFSAFMNAASEVEDLSLFQDELDLNDGNHEFHFQNNFSKLKRLSFPGFRGIPAFFEKIPDNSLNKLIVWSRDMTLKLDQDDIQDFLNRQMTIRSIEIPVGLILDLDHLSLEKLSFDESNYYDLAKVLEKQHTLCSLSCGLVKQDAFQELCKMPNLKTLHASFTQDVSGELLTLEALVVNKNCSFFHKVNFPNLKKISFSKELQDQVVSLSFSDLSQMNFH